MPNRIRTIFNCMNNIEEDNASLHILFKTTNNNPEKWEIRRMRSSENLIRDILELNRNFLSDFINNENLEVVNYQPGPNLGNDYIEQINIDNVGEFENIKTQTDECIDFFRDKSEIANYRPFAYVIKFEITRDNRNTDDSIYIFQHIQKQKSFKRGKILNRIHGTYDSLSDELYFLSEKFDCLYCDFENNTDNHLNYMFIFNKQHFDWIFGFEEIFKNEIRERLINNNEEFENIINFDDFAEFVINDYRFVRKTYKLLQNGNFNMYFNREVMERVPKEVNILELEWEDDRLIVNERNVKKILNIINEDYLRSIVSNTLFLSLSKTNI